MNKKIKICFLSTYVPRECGIATYTNNLIKAIRKLKINLEIKVIAINDKKYDYNKDVIFSINQFSKNSYIKAAQKINQSDFDLVVIEHEFGIFGGFNGNYLLYFLDHIKKPVFMTMHTIPLFQNKPFKIRAKKYKSRTKLLIKLFSKTQKISVMTDYAKQYLIKHFKLKDSQVCKIYHGAPFVSDDKLVAYKKKSFKPKFDNYDFVLSTFGLIAPEKGLEYVIKALSKIVLKYPKVTIKYIIAGRMRHGKPKKYLINLKKMVEKYQLSKVVYFDNRYLSYDEIYHYLANTDIYITPYYTKEQASSGTLTYAISAENAIVSTPYVFAYDIINQYQIGEFIKFKDYKSIVDVIEKMINNPAVIVKYQKNTRKLKKQIAWENVAKMFVNEFNKL